MLCQLSYASMRRVATLQIELRAALERLEKRLDP
jgi:hypothetical protein